MRFFNRISMHSLMNEEALSHQLDDLLGGEEGTVTLRDLQQIMMYTGGKLRNNGAEIPLKVTELCPGIYRIKAQL